ncbi:MAG: 4-hydroxybutyrate CoA-transferase [Acidimicrobiia bacterium]|nr:4-hydroxybutyrate CoA-transferase [Acidimicrobiia bacterium]
MSDTDLDVFGPIHPGYGRRGSRWVDAAMAVSAIPDGARVYLAGGATTPRHLCDALAEGRQRWERLDLVMPWMMTRPAPFDHPGEPFRFLTLQASAALKYLWATGAVEVVPFRYSDGALLFRPDGALGCDVALVTVSRVIDGKVSLGLSAGLSADVVRSAPLVIAQVSASMPYTYGASELPVDEVDFLVEHDEPVLEARPASAADEVGRGIASLAAGLVPDGATIQFGLGALPDAILGELRDRRRLRVHSGMVSDACVALHTSGAVEGAMVTAELVSTPTLTSWVDRNRSVTMAPAAVSHGAGVLAGLDRFVSLQSTLEVALDGSCNSEVSAGGRVSGPGGAPDFAQAATASAGGRSIIALRSTAAGGSISRIVGRIDPGRPTTLPAYLADAVVTEYGVAELRGLGLEARAGALRPLAAPEYRPSLDPTPRERPSPESSGPEPGPEPFP